MSSLLAITTRLPLSSSPAYLTSDLSSLLVAVVVVVALLTTVYAITRLLLSLALIIYRQDIARCQPRSHSIPSTFHPQMHKTFLHIGLHETRTRSDFYRTIPCSIVFGLHTHTLPLQPPSSHVSPHFHASYPGGRVCYAGRVQYFSFLMA